MFLDARTSCVKEGMLWCIVDLAGCFVDSPAGVHGLLQNPCRSLSGGPKRKPKIDLESATISHIKKHRSKSIPFDSVAEGEESDKSNLHILRHTDDEVALEEPFTIAPPVPHHAQVYWRQ